MINIRLDIAYDGTNYKGWQKQKDQATIQGEIEKVIYKISKEKVSLTAAGRTDAGVHAYKQVANYRTKTKKRANKISYEINSKLPGDIRILRSCQVSEDFHSRFDAKRKIYKYKIYNSDDLHPIYRNQYQEIYRELNIDLMEEAAKLFIGRHDFAAFSAGLSPKTNTMRSIDRIDFVYDYPLLVIEYEAESFIRNQLRIISGTLVQIGKGKRGLEDIEGIFESRDRTRAGPLLTGSGLYLVDVKY